MDKIFKIGVLVLGSLYLAYLFCPVANQVGRYSYHKSGDLISIMDTTNADVYMLVGQDKGGWIKANPRTGKSGMVEIVSPPKKTNK